MTPDNLNRTSMSFARRWRLISLLLMAPFSLLGVLGFAGIIRSLPDDKNQLGLYRKSPGCVAGASTSAALSPCIILSEHLVSKRSVHHSKNADDVYLTLQSEQAAPHEIQIQDYDFWFGVPVGTVVMTKTWHGRIVAVDAAGRKTMTSDDPNYIYSEDSQLAWLFGVGTVLFTGLCAIGLKQSSVNSVKK